MRRAVPATLLLALPALPALAAGGGEEGGTGLLYPTINFLILIAALVYFARKPVQEYFAERRGGIERDLASAEEFKREAEQRHAKWQRKLVDLDQELEGIRATSRERAEMEREHILIDARAAAERIRRDASTAIDQELRRARERLREEASDLAIELAGGLLREQVTDDDRARLLDEFIARIESADTPRADGNRG